MGTPKRKSTAMAKAAKTKSTTPTKSKGAAISKKPAPAKASAKAVSRPKGGKAAATPKSGGGKKPPAKKKPAAAPKKKVPGALKRKERFDDATTAEDEENERRVTSDGPDYAADDTGGNVSDDEDTVKEKRARVAKGPDTRSQKEKDADDAKAKSRATKKAARRGYRVLATRGGYSANPAYSTPSGGFDVAVPITTPGEAIRACKWAPTQADKPAFGGLTEFEERSALALESLPKSAARVLQMNGEQYLRRLVTDATQLMVDQCKPKITPAMVASVTRKLRGVQKYSFVAPHGLVRYSQDDAIGKRMAKFADEDDEAANEAEETLLDLQEKMKALLTARAELVKDGALLRSSDPKYDASLKERYDEVEDEIAELREKAAEASVA